MELYSVHGDFGMTRIQLIGAKRCVKLAVLVIPFLPAAPAFAQSASTTSLSGTVTDPKGSLVPNASLVLTNAGTHRTRNRGSQSASPPSFVRIRF
jgi:hypothetical protein